MKRWFAMLLCTAVFCALLPAPVYGDMGPKLSVVINFKGLEGMTYYVTLLSERESTGPYSAIKDKEELKDYYQEYMGDYEVFLKFVEYRDADGFSFLSYFQ